MGGGLMQLVAYGAQDVYLTGNPQITFFKVVYRRHTNFSVECIELTFSGNPGFGKNVTSTISRNGDLISKVYLKIGLPAASVQSGKFALCPNFGFAVINNVTCEIGGTQVDKQYGDWMYIWNELAGNRFTQGSLDKMIGNVHQLTDLSMSKPSYTLYVPLYFWFCRNNGLALPLIALQYHEVKIKVQFSDANQVLSTKTVDGAPTDVSSYDFSDATLLVDYIYLDTEERKRFAQASHEYLIEQLQFTGSENISVGNNKFRLNFNHPCKFLTWGVKADPEPQRPFLNTNMETTRDQLARLISLLKVQHNAGVTVPNDPDNGEAVVVVGHATSGVFADLAAKVDAVVAHDADNNSSIDLVALTRNYLTHDDLNISVDELRTAHAAWHAATNTQVSHLFNTFVNVRDPLSYVQNTDENPINTCKLQLNGHDRFSERDGNYFNYVQPWQHFTNTPSNGINVYSFALNPEEHQPSGTCNMSRIDNANLSVNSSQSGNFNVYAVNYNVLRIMSGMGGLAYSN